MHRWNAITDATVVAPTHRSTSFSHAFRHRREWKLYKIKPVDEYSAFEKISSRWRVIKVKTTVWSITGKHRVSPLSSLLTVNFPSWETSSRLSSRFLRRPPSLIVKSMFCLTKAKATTLDLQRAVLFLFYNFSFCNLFAVKRNKCEGLENVVRATTKLYTGGCIYGNERDKREKEERKSWYWVENYALRNSFATVLFYAESILRLWLFQRDRAVHIWRHTVWSRCSVYNALDFDNCLSSITLKLPLLNIFSFSKWNLITWT